MTVYEYLVEPCCVWGVIWVSWDVLHGLGGAVLFGFAVDVRQIRNEGA